MTTTIMFLKKPTHLFPNNSCTYSVGILFAISPVAAKIWVKTINIDIFTLEV